MENKPRGFQLTIHSKAEVDPEMSVLPIILMGDRMTLEYIPPSEEIKNEEGKTILYRPPNVGDLGLVMGRIASIGDSNDTEKPIPEKLRKLGLIVRYTKNFAEEFEYEKKTYHTVRASEVVSIV